MTDSLMVCADSTDPASISITHEAIYWDNEGWAQVGGVRVFRPDATNGVLWVRGKARIGNKWRTVDMALERRFLAELLARWWEKER
jgi:hypothetical protein